ncbi:MAG: hypothetical protein ACR2OO_15280 [Thermomicrobiales bacterium]
MLAGLSEAERAETWSEIEDGLREREGPDGFVGPCEVVIGIGVK